MLEGKDNHCVERERVTQTKHFESEDMKMTSAET